MRLRESQRKYVSHPVESAPLEIARAFDYPNTAFLNRCVFFCLLDLSAQISPSLSVDLAREPTTIEIVVGSKLSNWAFDSKDGKSELGRSKG